jgi:predicted MFS family arabinose efflux permease
MMLSDIVVVGSCLLAVRTLTVPNLCASRLLVGLSCGVSSSLIPPFLMSLSPPEWRGLAGSLHQLFVTVGVGFSFYLGQRLEDLTIFGVTNWRSYLFLPALYACVRTLMLLFFRYWRPSAGSTNWRTTTRTATPAS